MRLHDAMEDLGIASPYADRIKEWLEQSEAEGEEVFLDTDRQVTTKVECAEFFAVRDRALIAHATQIDPLGFWFKVPLQVQAEAWPTEDFELARSVVETTLPEDDLFAGIRGVDLVEQAS